MANSTDKVDTGSALPDGRRAIGVAPDAKSITREPLTGIFPQLLQRRRARWNRLLAEAFKEIERRLGKADAEVIFAAESFLSFVIEATLVACRNHDDAKIAAVRNAVIHSALPDSPDEPLRLMFLGLLGHMTPLHLAAVRVLNDPIDWIVTRGMGHPRWPTGTSARVIEYCVPAFEGKDELVELVVRDLQGAGLVQQGLFLRMPMSEDGFMQSRTTDTGREFVKFVSTV